ncbi:MAG TPA: conjugal transfer protein TraR, partial [Myxococcus sp.]|nr:conjugal transfer protein TraR [Myxococcus sp.]
MNQKDLKRYKKMLEDSKTSLLESAKKTLVEESSFDT